MEVRKIDSKKFHIDLDILDAIVKNGNENLQYQAAHSQLIAYVNEFPNGKPEMIINVSAIVLHI